MVINDAKMILDLCCWRDAIVTIPVTRVTEPIQYPS